MDRGEKGGSGCFEKMVKMWINGKGSCLDTSLTKMFFWGVLKLETTHLSLVWSA